MPNASVEKPSFLPVKTGMPRGEFKVISSGSRATNLGELMESPYDLCRFLQNRMVHSNMKVGEIARKAHLCHGTVSRMLYGETKDPRLNTVIQLLMAMGCKLYVK